jgi:isocitrate lyase
MNNTDYNRWNGIVREYGHTEIQKLRGSVKIEYTLANIGAQKFWKLLSTEDYIPSLGCYTGAQAVQCVQAGLKAIYVSGWQVAADANSAGQTYPDQSLYPVDSVPKIVERINNAFQRMDEIDSINGKHDVDWYAPTICDCEAGFGGRLNAYEITKAMIRAGASAVHFEDQLASEKKCGHLGGKVLCPIGEFIQKLKAARLAADVLDVPTIIIARTDALGAFLITSDIDDRDKPFCLEERTVEGFFKYKGGMEATIARGLAFAPYADLLWFETSEPDLQQATEFAKAIHSKYPGKVLAYNCSPSFNWKKKLTDKEISEFQSELGKLNYKFQFVTLAGFHQLNYGMFELAKGYSNKGMTAYADLQEREFSSEKIGYTATRHQQFVGTGYFDAISNIISNGQSSTTALLGSTETSQFH